MKDALPALAGHLKEEKMTLFGMEGGGNSKLNCFKLPVLKKARKRKKNDIINAKEAAKVLCCSYRTLLNLVRGGAIPGAKIGRSYQFSRKALEDWRRRKLTETDGSVPV